MGEDCEDCAIPPFRGGSVVGEGNGEGVGGMEDETKEREKSGEKKQGTSGRVVASKGRKVRKR